MQFVKTEDLKTGMRLARPIYNKQGVLLFERNSKLTQQGIISVKNFGLIGLYVLEPAEPVPPMTKEDIQFERFQTMAVFSIQEELEKILSLKKQGRTQVIASMIIKNYGHLDKRINFNQNLRSREDYVFKHSLNVAALCTMMTHVLNVKLDEQLACVTAAMVHDIGKVPLAPELLDGDDLDEEQKERLRKAETGAYELIESVYTEGTVIRRICTQSQKALEQLEPGEENSMKMVMGAKILAVADMYDSMTAMKLGNPPASEVKAIKYLLENPGIFDPDVVDALIKSVNILVPGISVELNTGEKALVLVSNEYNVLRPTVLSFHDNTIIDLSNEIIYDDIEIADIMKTLDNRYIFDTGTLRKAGFDMEGPDFV